MRPDTPLLTFLRDELESIAAALEGTENAFLIDTPRKLGPARMRLGDWLRADEMELLANGHE